jgi:hypothetical protein
MTPRHQALAESIARRRAYRTRTGRPPAVALAELALRERSAREALRAVLRCDVSLDARRAALARLIDHAHELDDEAFRLARGARA